MDKTGSTHHLIPPSTIYNHEPTAIRNSGSVPVEMEGCENQRFKERAALLSSCQREKKCLSLTFTAFCRQYMGKTVCFVDHASLYNPASKYNQVHNSA